MFSMIKCRDQWQPQIHPRRTFSLHPSHVRSHHRRSTCEAHAIFDTNGCDDIPQLIDTGLLSSYTFTKTYYTDGAYRDKGTHAGISTSVVVWTEKDSQGNLSWQQASETHKRDTGYADDAELYAIGMALQQARVHLAHFDFNAIVIFTDAQKVIRMFAGEKNVPKVLGPVPLEENWALQRIDEDAAALHNSKVNVIITWIKSHHRSNKGNKQAGRVAADATFDVMDGVEPIDVVPVEKKNWADVKVEYLYRRSRGTFPGRGT
ncbi:hypothetical protein BU23DRAFT_597145 [Bimuria novae-zelandiae CBS 107.79]|uniref:RNase H type-1 domain-containing protein n=1 Tax=Bimuria novae-zelandiae CBS 107.79 TaxID=1447943 RepID=A0A6A5VI11_9PLEO|nr:hypothetical protein BU23DRAFT_597145 [Bimuria novae-zelandiae CBS 107.79]